MKEFVEKLIGRLEEARQECQKLQKTTTDAYGYMKQKQGIDVAKEIVKQLAEEYKPQLNDNDLMIVEALPSLYPMKEFEEEALKRVIGCAKKEYNNGWIPCSERLPEKDMWCLATFESGNVDKIQYLVTNNWGWNGMRGDNKVIAWMPLPAPYKENENG